MKFINACLNCGFMDTNELEYNCPICKNVFYKLSNNDGKKLVKYNQIQRIQWVEDKIGHPIPYELNELRENYKNKKWKEIKQQKEYEQLIKLSAALEHGKAVLEGRDKGNKFGVECPYCHATNVKKITDTSKAVHTAIFGIFSLSRNSKQWHCTHCNSDF